MTFEAGAPEEQASESTPRNPATVIRFIAWHSALANDTNGAAIHDRRTESVELPLNVC
jgi:hypothetical protein